MNLEELQRFHQTLRMRGGEPVKADDVFIRARDLRYLESLVARAYEKFTKHERSGGFYRRDGFSRPCSDVSPPHRCVLPCVGHHNSGSAFGGLATALDPESRHVTMPFGHDHCARATGARGGIPNRRSSDRPEIILLGPF